MMESTRNLHIVLFIGVMCVVQTLALVCPYNDEACSSCYEEAVTCEGLSQIPPLITGANVFPVKQVRFVRGNITSISKKNLPHGLTLIELEDNPLTKISKDAFDASAATLEKVLFTKAKFNKLPTALKKLKKLKILSVADTPIQVWNTATLKQIGATVHTLALKNVSLSSWPRWIFKFRLLTELDLSWNSLKSIPDNAFRAIKDELKSLQLSGTRLTHVPKALSKLSSLDSLILSNNSFTDATEFKRIAQSPFASKLFYLNVKSVGLDRMPDFSKLTNLTIVDLSNNRISDVPAGSLPTSLKMLQIPDNLLSSVPKGLAIMSKLVQADLGNNVISTIEPNSFPLSLENLNLDSNKLTAITGTTFKNLKLLKSLHIGRNPISTITPSAFSDLVSLSLISIRSSSLTEIPLALTALKPNMTIFFTLSQPTPCTCPAPQQLVKWFTLLKKKSNFDVKCSNRQSVKSYLSDKCGTKPSPP